MRPAPIVCVHRSSDDTVQSNMIQRRSRGWKFQNEPSGLILSVLRVLDRRRLYFLLLIVQTAFDIMVIGKQRHSPVCILKKLPQIKTLQLSNRPVMMYENSNAMSPQALLTLTVICRRKRFPMAGPSFCDLFPSKAAVSSSPGRCALPF